MSPRTRSIWIRLLAGSAILASLSACTSTDRKQAAPAGSSEPPLPPSQDRVIQSERAQGSEEAKRDPRWAIEEGEGGFAYQGTRVTGQSVYVRLRAGYFREKGDAPKLCVLYLEGLGDSVLNHQPLFSALSDAGYRTIFFDYMGQGGSEGTMNDTRIVKNVNRSLQVSTIADRVWERYSQGCEGPRVVMGWSTGGLAAYDMARRSWADAVVLIAPGVVVREFVGEAHGHPAFQAALKPVITARTLTRAPLGGKDDPHVEGIRPNNPLRAPLFAVNLVNTSLLARNWDIPRKVKGIVFLSDSDDAYVDTDATEKALKKHAPQFRRTRFDHAYHELDNELPEVASRVRAETIEFLDSLAK